LTQPETDADSLSRAYPAKIALFMVSDWLTPPPIADNVPPKSFMGCRCGKRDRYRKQKRRTCRRFFEIGPLGSRNYWRYC
jgi:hypothetical protein